MKISVLVPCHNERLTIKKCISSILDQSRKADEIIVVNDGSTDKTLTILKSFKKNIRIVNILHNTGNKSRAHEAGLKHVKGDIVITTDADTVLDRDFIKHIMEEFNDTEVVASAGYVKSMKQNWLTSCRQIDYLISQEIHKPAQCAINALFVIPGCAAAYRVKDFREHISFDHDTLTEDLDFTYKHHKKGLKITFCKRAVVYTQDPSSLADYIGQLRRWNGGNWQNLMKHISIVEKPGNALEISLMYLEGLLFPLILILALSFNTTVFLQFSAAYILIISLFALYGAIRDKRWDLVLHIPTYYFVSFVNYAIFIEQFIVEVVLRKKSLVWFQPKRKVVFS